MRSSIIHEPYRESILENRKTIIPKYYYVSLYIGRCRITFPFIQDNDFLRSAGIEKDRVISDPHKSTSLHFTLINHSALIIHSV